MRDRIYFEVSPPAQPPLRGWRRTAHRLFSDENLDLLAHLLDDLFRIPGTPVRLGLDGLVGLIPGLGDVIGGIFSSILIFAAWVRGVPYVTLARMMVNLTVAVGVGAIPLLGDVFDIFWKANRRNYTLMVRHLRQPHIHTWKDYAFLLCLAGIILVVLALPLLVLALIVLWLMHRF